VTSRPPRDAPTGDDRPAVVLLPPQTPAEADEAWQRLVEVLDWLATLGAMDA
jgi:hypothetical protein